MCCSESVNDLGVDVIGARERYWSFIFQDTLETCAFQIIHDQIWLVGCAHAKIEQGYDMVVAHLRDSFCFPAKASDGLRFGDQVRMQHFYGHEAIHLLMPDFVNNAHAAATENRQNFVAIGKPGADKRI